MYTALMVIYFVCCIFLILTVLLQAGKGGGMGIGFGSSTSQTVFGGSGAGNFLSRMTAFAATVFIVLSLVLARMSSHQDSPRLRQLAAEKAAEKSAEEKRKAAVLKSVDKAREAIGEGQVEAPATTEGNFAAPVPSDEAAPAEEEAAAGESDKPAPESNKAPAAAEPAKNETP